MEKKKIKGIGWVFLVLGIAYLINPFDLPGPIDDALTVGAASIIKVICDYISMTVSKKLTAKNENYVEV